METSTLVDLSFLASRVSARALVDAHANCMSILRTVTLVKGSGSRTIPGNAGRHKVNLFESPLVLEYFRLYLTFLCVNFVL